MSFYTFVSVVSALVSVAQAKDNDDVKYALEILNDLPADLAEPFCGTFGGQQYGGATSTYTITAAPITITTTTPCSGYKETKVLQNPYFRFNKFADIRRTHMRPITRHIRQLPVTNITQDTRRPPMSITPPIIRHTPAKRNIRLTSRNRPQMLTQYTPTNQTTEEVFLP